MSWEDIGRTSNPIKGTKNLSWGKLIALVTASIYVILSGWQNIFLPGHLERFVA